MPIVYILPPEGGERGVHQSGVVCRYYVCDHGRGLYVCGGDHGLVQPLCGGVRAVSNTLETDFCLEALEQALARHTPETFNCDQGVQFTSQAWIERVQAAGSLVRMAGRERVFDNIFFERL